MKNKKQLTSAIGLVLTLVVLSPMGCDGLPGSDESTYYKLDAVGTRYFPVVEGMYSRSRFVPGIGKVLTDLVYWKKQWEDKLKQTRTSFVVALTLLLVFSMTFLTACEEDDTTGPQENTPVYTSDDYYPLSPGSNWHYSNYEGETLSLYMDLQQGAATTLDGYEGVPQIGYFIALSGDTTSETPVYTYALVNDTVKFQIAGTNEWRVAGAAALLPWYEPGDTIAMPSSGNSLSIYISHDESVTVPAGTFDGCAHIRYIVASPSDTTIDEMYYAPGVGKVLVEYHWIYEGEDHLSYLKLEEYSVE